ncbi:MAG: hypothetical protein R3A13_06885 [Bdellovibrionota bacterium]
MSQLLQELEMLLQFERNVGFGVGSESGVSSGVGFDLELSLVLELGLDQEL